jgi:hypothetical protein
MQTAYIKHGTFLVEFGDCVKTIQGDWFLEIKNKTIQKHKKMFEKQIILLMLKDDVTFKGVVVWFENTT